MCFNFEEKILNISLVIVLKKTLFENNFLIQLFYIYIYIISHSIPILYHLISIIYQSISAFSHEFQHFINKIPTYLFE